MFKRFIDAMKREGSAAALWSPWFVLIVLASWIYLFTLAAENACEERGLDTSLSFKDYHFVYSCEVEDEDLNEEGHSGTRLSYEF